MKYILLTAIIIVSFGLLYLGAQAQDSTSGAEKTETVEQTRVYVPDEMHFTNIKDYLVERGDLELVITSQVWDGDPTATTSQRVGTARTKVASSTLVSAFYTDLLQATGNPFEAILKAHKSQGDVPSDLDIPTNLKNI